MNPNETNMSPEMSPDDAMAALAISTRLSEQMMAQQAPQGEGMPVEGEITPETALGGTETPETVETAPMEETPQETPNITDEITKGLREAKTELKDELKDMIKSELKKLMDDDEDNKEDNE
jgi:hypothetical protein